MEEKESRISEKAENIMRKSRVKGNGVEIPLYERRKGMEFHASGSWQTTKGERLIIETFGWMFFLGVFAGLIVLFIHPGAFAYCLLGVGIAGAVGTFISLFAIAFKKNKEEPMETHGYDTDCKYNAFTGEETNYSREITKEEFLGNNQKLQ